MSKLNPFEAFHLVTSVKLHFDDKYDAVKYRFRLGPRMSPATFDARRDKYFFERLARNHSDPDDCLWYVVANVMVGNGWIGKMTEEPFVELSSWHQAATYKFETELNSIRNRFGYLDDALECDARLSGTRPPALLTAYINEDISIHTIAIMNCLTGFLKKEMTKVSDPLGMLGAHATKIQKYSDILTARSTINAEKCRDVILKLFSASEESSCINNGAVS